MDFKKVKDNYAIIKKYHTITKEISYNLLLHYIDSCAFL